MAVDMLSTLNKNGSGINIKELTSTLVDAEISPRKKVEQGRIDNANVTISALGKVKAQLATVQTAMASLNAVPTLQVTSSSSAITTTITDRSKLQETNSTITVQQTAKPHVMEFTGFTSATAPVGAGVMKVEFGVWGNNGAGSFTVNSSVKAEGFQIQPGATLSDIAKALDSLDGVSARVLDKGDGTFSLGVVGDPGASNGLRFTVTPDAANPGLDSFDTTTTNSTRQVQGATDALLTVDGFSVQRSSNTITDLVPGLELTLSGATTDASLTVTHDKTTTKDNLDFLVGTINDTTALLGKLTARAKDGGKAGELAGDASMEALKHQLSALIASPMNARGSKPVYLSDLGVATQLDGTLKLDATAFDKKFAADPAAFDALFADNISSETSGVSLTGKPGAALASGSLAFHRDSVTGEATLAGTPLLALAQGTGSHSYTAFGGSVVGLTVTVPDTINDATLSFGRSFVSSLDALMTTALSSDSGIARRETQVGKLSTDATARLAELDTRAAALQDRYTARFAAMETAVTQLHGTGTYLTNLVAQWNKSTN